MRKHIIAHRQKCQHPQRQHTDQRLAGLGLAAGAQPQCSGSRHGQCRFPGKTANPHIIHIAVDIIKIAPVIHQPAQRRRQTAAALGRNGFGFAAKALLRDHKHKAHQHHIDGFAGADQGRKHQQLHKLGFSHRFFHTAQAHRQHGKRQADHQCIGRKACRQLQPHGQQGRAQQKQFSARNARNGKAAQGRIHGKAAQAAQQHHGEKSHSQHPRQRNAQRLRNIQKVHARGRNTRRYRCVRRLRAHTIGQMLRHALVSQHPHIAGFGFHIGCIGAAHQKLPVLLKRLLPQHTAGQRIAARQMRIFIGGHHGRRDQAKCQPQHRALHGKHLPELLRPGKQHQPRKAHRCQQQHRHGGIIAQKPVPRVFLDQLQRQRAARFLQRQRCAGFIPLRGFCRPKAQPILGLFGHKADLQRVFSGFQLQWPAAGENHIRKGVVQQRNGIQHCGCRLGFTLQEPNPHLPAAHTVVGGKIQPNAIQLLRLLQHKALAQRGGRGVVWRCVQLCHGVVHIVHHAIAAHILRPA